MSTTAAPAHAPQSPGKAWTVAVGAMLCMIAGSVPLSGLSFFHPYLFQVMGAEGHSQSAILLYFTLLMLAIVVSMVAIGGPLLPKLGGRWLMIGGSLTVAAALVGFAQAQTPLGLYAAGILLGLGYGASFQLVPMVWVNNWFVAHKGTAVGLVAGGTGLGGVLWSILIPALAGVPTPANQSFRLGYYVMAVVTAVLTIAATLLLARPDHPSDAGLEPLGGAKDDDSAAKKLGYAFKDALRSPWLWLIFAASVLLGIVHGAAQIMAPYLTLRVTASPPLGMGEQLTYYSLLMSIWTVALVAMKPLLGFLNDRIGLIGAYALALVLQSVFFLFMPHVAAFGTILPIVGMIFMSAGMSTGTVQPPLITAQAMGPRDFGKIWSVTGTAYMLGMAAGAPIWGLFYDPQTRGYDLGFMLAPLALAAVLVLSWLGLRGGRRGYLGDAATR